MTSPNLERLARAGELKVERFSRHEWEGLLRRARALLGDAMQTDLSLEGRFGAAYGAAHALANAALRLQGYRSENRYLVFQCLEHTVGLTAGQCRLFALCHDRRNRAEYLGHFEMEETLVHDLIRATDELLSHVGLLAPPE